MEDLRKRPYVIVLWYVQTQGNAGKLPHMDPVGIKLEEADLIAPDFPLPHAFEGSRTPSSAIAGFDDDETVEGDPDSAAYLLGDWFAPTPHRPLHSTRCVAINKGDGKRCRQWSVIGFTRCVKHSGYSKLANLQQYRERVLERARLDLLKGAPYAVESLVEMARDREINPAVRLKASESVLDRIGVKGGTDVTVTVEADGASPAEIIRARLERLAAASAALAATASESEIIEGEVLDDDDAAV